jgi:hypothetical protein
VQKRVYEALLDLSPEQLEFEFELLPEERSFCVTGVDQDTYDIIGHIMGGLLEQKDLILTLDDIKLCYYHFRELMYLKAGVEQGLLKIEMTGNDLEYFYNFEPQEKPAKKIYKAQAIRPYRGIA